MNPIDEARARLSWAEKHVDALEEEIRRFLEEKPYRTERKDDSQTGTQFFHAYISQEPRIELALLAADAINSLRSILDNLVWHLSKRQAEGQKISFNARVPEFPVCDSKEDWSGQKWHVKYLPPEAQRFVESCQPYHALTYGAGIDESNLWILDTLWNYNKHRSLSMLAFVITNVSWQSNTTDVDCFVTPRVYHDGSEIAAAVPRIPNTQLDVKADFTFDVAFGPEPIDGRPVIETLRNLHDLIRDYVIPPFAREFR